MDERKLERVVQMLEAMNGTEQDITAVFADSFEKIVDFVKETRDLTQEEYQRLEAELTALAVKLENDTKEQGESVKRETRQKVADVILELQRWQDNAQQTIEDRLTAVQDGVDADEERVISEVLNRIPAPEIPEPDTAEDIRNKLELLEDDERLDISAVKGFDSKFDDLTTQVVNLAGRRIGGGGSGVEVYDSNNRKIGSSSRLKFPGASFNQDANGSIEITISGSGGTWGSITGTLSDQTDLQNALDAKIEDLSSFDTDDLSEGATNKYNVTHTGDATGATALSVVALRGVGLDSTVGSPTDGKILVYRSAGTDWVLEDKPAGGSNPAINDITDITITTPADNEILAYDNGTSEWINQTPSEAGFATVATTGSYSDLTGEPTVATGATDNAVLRADGTGGSSVQASGITIDDSDNISGVNYQDFDAIAAPTHSEGRVFYDSTAKTLSYYNEEVDITMNLGRESWIRVYNNSGSTITNGQACTLSGYNVANDLPQIELCQTDDTEKARFAGLATHDIENASVGYITNYGRVNGLDTSSFTAGETLFLDATTAGALTETRPDAPAYIVPIGTTVKSNATTGSIFVGAAAIHGGNARLAEAFWNGAIVEDVDVDVTSNGTVITLSLQQQGGGDLTLLMGETRQTLDCTPAATVSLTAGSDASPQINYIYVPASTDALTASTSGWPSEQHVPIATVFTQSAASLQTDGAMKVHVWNDHISDSDNQGHLSHLNRWMRNQNATWLTGVAVTPTAGANTLDIATTAGTVLQLHDHPYPAFDTSTGSEIYVVNDPDAAYTKVASLTQADGVDKDANGTTLGASSTDFYNLVLWGVVSENSSESKLMCNVPNGAYSNDNGSQASDDANNTAVYTIPEEFKGTGFLIARLTVRENGGTYTVENNVDLRGQQPGFAGGQGTFGGNEFADNVFRIQDDGDTTKQLAFQTSSITTATTRTLTVPDVDGTIVTSANPGDLGGVLEDIDTLGTAASDGEFIVATGAGAFAYESGATVRASLGLGSAAVVATDLADLNEVTIEAAIDTLANLTSIQGFTIALADAAADAVLGWDDTAGQYENLTGAEVGAIVSGNIAISDLSDSGDVVTPSSTDTFTNKTFDANGTGNSLSNVETADIASGSKSGADATLITGTAGTDQNLIEWDSNGDAIDSGIGAADVKTKANNYLIKAISIEDPSDSEDITLFFTDDAITVSQMNAVLLGSSTPSVTWTIRHGTDRSATGAEVVTSGTTTTSTSTGSEVTSFNDATIVAGSWVWVETTAQSGTVDEINISIEYTAD